jgi:hypothetical protein
MAFSYPQNTGTFIPQTNVWDVNEIYAANLDPKLTELLVRMYQNLGLMATNVNYKDAGYYVLQPFINGQLYFPNPGNNSSTSAYPASRQVSRLVVNFGALPNAATKSVPHNLTINAAFTFTRIYACATNPSTEFIPIPYASTVAGNNVELWVDPTNVNIRTAANYSAYTTTYVVLEWIQS